MCVTYEEKSMQLTQKLKQLAKDTSVDLMPQILATVSLLRQIYEHSVDLADLVV